MKIGATLFGGTLTYWFSGDRGRPVFSPGLYQDVLVFLQKETVTDEVLGGRDSHVVGDTQYIQIIQEPTKDATQRL